jgi:hypothetical protein
VHPEQFHSDTLQLNASGLGALEEFLPKPFPQEAWYAKLEDALTNCAYPRRWQRIVYQFEILRGKERWDLVTIAKELQKHAPVCGGKYAKHCIDFSNGQPTALC